MQHGASSGGPTNAGRAAAATAIVLWSMGNVIVKHIDMSGTQVAFWRLLLGAVVYGAVFVARGGTFDRRRFLLAAPTALAISLEIVAFFVAIKATTVANTTVIGALAPLLLLVVAARRFRERVDGVLVVAGLVAFVGVGMVVFGSTGRPVWSLRGDLLAVVAMVLFAAYFVFAKAARESLGTFELQTLTLIIGSVVLAPLAVIDADGRFDVPSAAQWPWIALVLLVPGTGHLLMNWSHPHTHLTYTSMITLAIPVLSTSLAAWWLAESFGPRQAVGMVVVVAALAVVIRHDVRDRPLRLAPSTIASPPPRE
ncbi:MAG: DMT family transporter [Acidimicrobiia bacterium]|nr:DMT family transporter [Acidimicrobiia bacterium]